MSANTEEEVLAGILPQVTIDKIVLESSGQNTESTSDDKTLKVTLYLTIKEILDNNELGSWFNNLDFRKYLKLHAVQSSNSRVTEALSFSNDMIAICNQFHKRGRLNIKDAVTKAFAFINGNTKLSEIYGLLSSYTKLQEISVNDTSKDITDYPSYLNSEGNRVYEISYKTSFNLTTLNPEHLSYFVVSSLDIQSMCEDYRIDYETIKNDIEEIGRVYSEIVINNSNVSSESYIYTDQNNVVWYGPVHQDAQGLFKSGNEDSINSIVLNRVVVQNSKIQDFRNFEEIQKRIFDFNNIGTSESGASISLEQQLNKVTKIQGLEHKPENHKPKFTNLFISRDFQSNVKFLFGIDFKNIIKENSKFGILVDNGEEALERLLKNVKILDLKIIRRRVKNNFNLSNSSAKYEYEKFDIEQPDEIILQTSDNKFSQEITFLSVNNRKASIRETNLAFTNPYSNMRYFTGVDKTLSQVTDGIYQYYIELQIEDKITDYLNNQVNRLEEVKNSILEYYARANSPTMRKFFIEVQDPHIQSLKESSTQNDFFDYGYDIISNKFSPQLVNRLKRNVNRPWEIAPFIFSEVLSIFSKNQSAENNQVMQNALATFLNPDSANPSSILKTIEIFEYLINSISRMIGRTVDNNSSSPSRTGGSKINKTFKITNFFNETVNSNLLESYGVEYLSTSFRTNNDGLTSITYDSFYRRISSEMLKFFKTENPVINFGSEDRSVQLIKYSFLTPVRLDFFKNSIITTPTTARTLSANRNIEYFYKNINMFNLGVSMQSDILNFKLDINGKNTYRTVKSDLRNLRRQNQITNQIRNRSRTSKKITELFSDFGNVTILSHDLRTKKTNTNEEIINTAGNSKAIIQFMSSIASGPIRSKKTNLGFYSSNNMMTENVQGIDNNIITNISIDYIETISKLNYQVNFQVTEQTPDDNVSLSANFNPNAPRASNTSRIVSLPQPFSEEEPQNIPCQFRGLIFKSELNQEMFGYSNYVQQNFENYIKNKVINYFNYEMIVEIEYLSGFEQEQDGAINSISEIWKRLDSETLREFVDGREILCRFKPYQNTAFYAQPNLDVYNSCYNKYFVIKTSQSRPTPPRFILTGISLFNPIPVVQAIQNSFRNITNNLVDNISIRRQLTRESTRDTIRNNIGSRIPNVVNPSRTSGITPSSTNIVPRSTINTINPSNLNIRPSNITNVVPRGNTRPQRNNSRSTGQNPRNPPRNPRR